MDTYQNIKGKILSREDLIIEIRKIRQQGLSIVFTNGCFDIIHQGHIRYLAEASDMGDILIVGLNTDDSVKKLKGKNRPIQDQGSRAITLAAISFIDYIVLFDEDTPLRLIEAILPDILVKGGDYAPEKIIGYDIVQSAGGRVVTIPLEKGYSTSIIINKLSAGKTNYN
jgi:rfaE bifunctional protein nucleotidyltransferase chain/domain